MKHNAEITIASDAAGLNSEFYFKTTTGEKFRFYLAFQSTIPTSSVVAISDKKTFESVRIKLPSPIGGDDETTNNYTLEGKIKLYTDAATVTPITGVYSSIIYVLVKKKV